VGSGAEVTDPGRQGILCNLREHGGLFLKSQDDGLPAQLYCSAINLQVWKSNHSSVHVCL